MSTERAPRLSNRGIAASHFLLVRAHRWFNMLNDGTVGSISELARNEDVQRTYTSRVIPLAFLAPDIIETILDGRQPIDLSLDRILEAMPLPLAWSAQRTILGFRARKRDPIPAARFAAFCADDAR